MRRVFALVLTIPLLLALIEPNAVAKKRSRSGRATVQAGRDSRGKARRGRVQASRGRRGRNAYVARGTRGRHSTRSRSRRFYAAQPVDSTVTSRPAPGISAERVTEIQNALIKAGYLDGPPSGQYDEPTIGAMKQFQSKSGLPGNGMPSALALKKLGVSKRTNDGYAVSVTSVSQNEKKHP
ncbi:MAG TPA: peptidoglycan-binding domain-containing protein [Blastocatellia bacterium]|nr:peptidoglycan-binding domain-containing protein [Blastocatellia bacterium]